jgi:hypothetical protein
MDATRDAYVAAEDALAQALLPEGAVGFEGAIPLRPSEVNHLIDARDLQLAAYQEALRERWGPAARFTR